MEMRPKKTAYDLPPRMLRRTKKLASGKVWTGYYYNGRDENGRRKEIPLGTDLAAAKRKWAELEGRPEERNQNIMQHIFDRYEREIIPTKAPSTQNRNIFMLRHLRTFFGTAPINEVMPRHVAQYRDSKKTANINNEIALFSHAFDMAREWGYTDKENPAKGVRKIKLKPRDYYVEKPIWDAVYSCACNELRDAMDLAYLTGQRPGDILKMSFSDIRDGALEVKQGKTGKKLRIIIKGTELEKTIDRIRSRRVSSMYLVSTSQGKKMTMGMLFKRFNNARLMAIEAHPDIAEKISRFQFRDIRPMAATDITDLDDASNLLGHTKQDITKRVYRRLGIVAKPTR